MSEYVVNKRLYDDKSAEAKIVNDITVGKYDLVVVAGSTLPSNRYAELEFYMDAYSKGLIDRQEVLKKTEVFDIEGVMQRMDTIAQLQQQLQQAGEKIKELSGDLQTRDREAVNLRKKVEVEKFKTGLDKTKNKSQAAATVFDKRLDDEMKNIRTNIATATKANAKS
jgi:TolA-binding protein